MKKRSLIAIIMILTMGLSLLLSSCFKKPDNLEGYVKSNKEVMEQIESEASTQGMKVEVKGNAISYVYDLASAAGVDEESIKDPVVQEGLTKVLEEGKDQFIASCKELEDTTGLSGISITVTFEYNGETIATQTFSSAE